MIQPGRVDSACSRRSLTSADVNRPGLMDHSVSEVGQGERGVSGVAGEVEAPDKDVVDRPVVEKQLSQATHTSIGEVWTVD
jgi:hypothetical protein